MGILIKYNANVIGSGNSRCVTLQKDFIHGKKKINFIAFDCDDDFAIGKLVKVVDEINSISTDKV